MVDQTMSNTDALQEIELSIKQASEHVEFGNAVERLRSNRDFKKVITEGYFEKEAVRLVHLKADVSMQSPAMQADIVKQMDGIGALNQFFGTKLHLARMAGRSIESDEQTREELLAEDIQA